MEYSRISSIESKLEAVDLNQVLNEVSKDFAPQLQAARGQLAVEENLPKVLGDSLQVYRIFANLVGNAIKYKDPARPPEIKITKVSGRDSHYLNISVADNGLGIPSEKLQAVFRPFQRAHGNSVEGSGIGLATVKKVLEKLGGSVELQSQVGSGSSFLLSLKLAQGNDTKHSSR